MYALENEKGSYVKDGIRYIIIREGIETSEDRDEYALLYDYVEDPLTPLAIKKIEIKTQMRLWRERKLAEGFTYGGKSYQTRNDGDRINLMSISLAALSNKSVGQGNGGPERSSSIRAGDNSVSTLNTTEALELYEEMINASQAVWDEYLNADAALDAALTINDAEVIYAGLS